MNFSKLAFTMLITSSLFVACSDEISMNTVDTQYTANAGSIKNAGQAVDLGLPSGTKWANMNVGATSESDNGILFVWGDVSGTQVMATSATTYTDVTPLTSTDNLFNFYKAQDESTATYNDTLNVHTEAFSLAEYTMTQIDSIREVRFDSIKAAYEGGDLLFSFSGDDATYVISADLVESNEVKYFGSTQGGFNIDNGANIQNAPVYSIVGDAQHDPATSNWGGNWKMPTADQLQELMEKCKWEDMGNGYKVTGPNGNSIFLPAAGYRYGDKLYGNGNAGYYACGEIVGAYHFPSLAEQLSGSTGSISGPEDMPNMLIFQHGQFNNSVNIYNNLSTSYGISIRPVAK